MYKRKSTEAFKGKRSSDIVLLTPDKYINFGKYRGTTVKIIMEIKPQYIAWLISTDNRFIPNNDLVNQLIKLKLIKEYDRELNKVII